MKPNLISPARTARKSSGAPKAKRDVAKAASDAPAPAVQQRKGRGRPSSYRPEYCATILEFFVIDLERVERVSVPDGKGGVIVIEERRVNRFPTFSRFAHSLNVSAATLRRWSTAVNKDGSPKYERFAECYSRARDAQESLLVEGGMSGLYNSRFSMMTAKNLLGWRSAPESTDHQAINATSTAKAMRELEALYVDLFQQHEAQREERGEA
jgi:hypothetical protein